jgi:sec-independent protein translocase protein TatB
VPPYAGWVFESVGWGEIFVLVVAGLFILGPERLPSAAAWVGKTVRQVREYATGARDQLRRELGPEFDELRKPLEDLRGLRDFNPRRAVQRSLFDDDPAPVKPNGYAGPNGSSASAVPNGSAAADGAAGTSGLNGASTYGGRNGSSDTVAGNGAAPAASALAPGERPPIDPDAT